VCEPKLEQCVKMYGARKCIKKILSRIIIIAIVVVVLLQLVFTPPLMSTSIFVTVIHMMVMMCVGCPDLAVVLLKLSEF